MASSSASSAWERTSWVSQQRDDLGVPGRLGQCGSLGSAGGHDAPRVIVEEDQDRLLDVAAVLGLVPDHRLRAVDHLGGDLLAAVRGQAVQHDRVRRRPGPAARRRRRTGGSRLAVERRRPPGPSRPRCRWPARRARRGLGGRVGDQTRCRPVAAASASARSTIAGSGWKPAGRRSGRAARPAPRPAGRSGPCCWRRRRGRPGSDRRATRGAPGWSAGRPGSGTGGSRRSAR